MTMKKYIAKVETRIEALVLVGNLLAGNITVNIDTNEMTEATKNEQLFDVEFVDILKAFGVEKVPVEILARVGERTVETTDEITIDDITEQIDEMTAKGLLHDLLDGTTQIDKKGIVYWCYGGQDGVKHNYATIKACIGDIDINDICEMYAYNWLEADIEVEEYVEKLIRLIRG